jgi:hypothetical protein
VIFLDEGLPKKAAILTEINALGATFENCNGRMYALDLKPEVEFDPVADYLEVIQAMGLLKSRFAPQPQPRGTADLLQ